MRRAASPQRAVLVEISSPEGTYTIPPGHDVCMYLDSIKSFSIADALCHIISRSPSHSEYAHSHRGKTSLEHYVRESKIPSVAVVSAEVYCTD